MSRAQVRLEVNETIQLEGATYRVAEHPALPGIPYIQRGGRGFVIQLIALNGERLALKYFKLKYRVPELVSVAEALRQFADLPGLRAARRTVYTKAKHPTLIDQYPALEYGMLMPWLPGLTWYDVITTRSALSQAESLRLAKQAAAVLASLESRGVAHGDIAGGNVLVDRKTGGVELVDIEEMCGAGMPKPVEAPGGQDGYQHRDGRAGGQWRPEGDRFGAAVLFAEMLGWHDSRVRAHSADEHYFATAEMQDAQSTRFRLLSEVIRDHYGPDVAELFRAAWVGQRLADCPPLSAWQTALSALPEPAQVAQPATQPGSPTPIPTNPASPRTDTGVVSGRRAIGIPVPSQPEQNLSPQPAPPSEGMHATPNADRVSLENTRLCRNCGAANNTAESFCKRCGFYIGVGARKPLSVMVPKDRGVGAPGAKPAAPKAPPPPQQVALNRKLNEVVTAKRVGDPAGGGLQRVETPKDSEPPAEANAGSVLVAVIIFGLVAAAVVLFLIAGGG